LVLIGTVIAIAEKAADLIAGRAAPSRAAVAAARRGSPKGAA